MTTVTTARSAAAPSEESLAWRDRSARLYEELRRPARAMVRRAFRGAFTDDEVEDVYSNAWVGTLRALERRHADLDDEEIRKYVLTAVAHHASKELRRRKRRPVSPLEGVHAVPDDGLTPDETAAKREDSQIARDVLSSLPPRRRAVMLLRYGWGLEPQQVCGLVKGLSRRAYRKEITRGVDELATKLRQVQSGEWCSDREPLLKAYAAGVADDEQRLQAQLHLSHCRHCTDFVGRLSGHLHDIGSAAAIPTAAEALGDGRFSLVDRAVDLAHRVKESGAGAFSRVSTDATQEGSAQTISVSSGARGAGAAGTGLLTKIAGAGTAGKLATVCLGGGLAASACLATGVVPAELPGLGGGSRPDKPAATVKPTGHATRVQTAQLGAPADASAPPAPPPAPDPRPTTTTPRRRQRRLPPRRRLRRPRRRLRRPLLLAIRSSMWPRPRRARAVAAPLPVRAGAARRSRRSSGRDPGVPSWRATVGGAVVAAALIAPAMASGAGRTYEVVQCDPLNRGVAGAALEDAPSYAVKQGCGDPKEDHAIKISNTRFAQQGRSGRVRWSTQSPSLGIVGASVQANLRRDRGHMARLWMADADGDEIARVAAGSKKATGFRHYSWDSSGPRAEQFIAHLRCDHRGGCKHSEVAKTWLRNIHFEVADYADPRLTQVEGHAPRPGWVRGTDSSSSHRCGEWAI